MKDLTSILVVLDRSVRDSYVLRKAADLARRFDARLELFLCDAEHEYQLRHSYDPGSVGKARELCLADAGHYLESLCHTVEDRSLQLTWDAACESPLYEGIVKKASRSGPDLVLKSPSREHPGRRPTLSDNDWQLARACPVPLMLVSARPWDEPCRFAAAVDASANETPGLARAILHNSEYLQMGYKGTLDVISCRPSGASEAEREEHAGRMRELAADIRVNADHVHVLEGDPEHVLPAFAASRHYDLLVLGALTHRPGLTSLVGTLTSKLVDVLECDFLLVKPGKAGELRGRSE
jgi:universal stress protein E